MKPKIKHPKADPKKNPELKALSHLVGEFIEYWGFKAIQGRMWCYLYLLREPLNSRQLAQLLEISPALVTQSVQVLLEYRVILEAGKGPNGILRFQANPNVAEAVSSVLSQRESVLLRKVQSAQKSLLKSSDDALDRDRVKQVGHWVGLAQHFLDFGIESLDQPSNPFETPGAFEAMLEPKL
jgi:DNA-binding transcriptional regulator GbsR (MarR family)